MPSILIKALKCLLPYGLVRIYQKFGEAKAGERLSVRPDAAGQFPARNHEDMLVLAGGPSVLEHWDHILLHRPRMDLFTVNGGMCNPNVVALKPDYHALLDPLYFGETRLEAEQDANKKMIAEALAAVKKTLVDVDWPLTLYVPDRFLAEAAVRYGTNPQIAVAGVPSAKPDASLAYPDQFALLDKGMCSCGMQNSVLTPLYLSIAARYEKIWVTGLDMDYFSLLRVDEHCRCFYTSKHHYEETVMHVPCMADILYRLSRTFTEFDYAWHYARHAGVSIINTNVNSLLDSFPKGHWGQDPLPFLRYTAESVT